MVSILLGAALGAAVGSLNHRLLLRAVSPRGPRDEGAVRGLARLFTLRYGTVALALLAFWLFFRSGPGEVALALTAIWTSRFLLHRTLRMGGGRS